MASFIILISHKRKLECTYREMLTEDGLIPSARGCNNCLDRAYLGTVELHIVHEVLDS